MKKLLTLLSATILFAGSTTPLVACSIPTKSIDISVEGYDVADFQGLSGGMLTNVAFDVLNILSATDTNTGTTGNNAGDLPSNISGLPLVKQEAELENDQTYGETWKAFFNQFTSSNDYFFTNVKFKDEKPGSKNPEIKVQGYENNDTEPSLKDKAVIVTDNDTVEKSQADVFADQLFADPDSFTYNFVDVTPDQNSTEQPTIYDMTDSSINNKQLNIKYALTASGSDSETKETSLAYTYYATNTHDDIEMELTFQGDDQFKITLDFNQDKLYLIWALGTTKVGDMDAFYIYPLQYQFNKDTLRDPTDYLNTAFKSIDNNDLFSSLTITKA